jgi:hypothetical protein
MTRDRAGRAYRVVLSPGPSLLAAATSRLYLPFRQFLTTHSRALPERDLRFGHRTLRPLGPYF